MQPRFIVGIDFAAPSEAALALAATYAQSFGGVLSLIHIVDYPGIFSGAERRDLYEEHQGKEAEKQLHKLQKQYSALGIPVETHVVNGSTEKELMAHVERENGDMIFIGTHGHRPSEIPFLGTVTLHVLRESHRPVMVVRQTIETRDAEWLGIAPVSRDYGIRGLIQYFTANHWGFKVKMDLVHVLSDGESVEQATRFLERKLAEIQEANLPAGLANIIEGEDVAAAVHQYIASTIREYDLLLLENRHKANFGAMSVGSAMEMIILSCKRPVLCVRSGVETEEDEE